MLKLCRSCNTQKERTEFSKNTTRCKPCDSLKGNKRLYSLSAEKRRALWLKASHKTKDKHPTHHAARVEVQKAIKRGDLVRKPCEVCDEPKTQGHHDDYSKPLVVRWLCHKHHRAVHYKNANTLTVPTQGGK